MALKRYREVQIGETFSLAGFRWTVIEILSPKSYLAETPLPGRSPMVREFSSEIGEMYFGDPDPEDDNG